MVGLHVIIRCTDMNRSFSVPVIAAICALLSTHPAAALDAGRLAGALSGHWTDPAHPGEGFTVEILEDQRGLAFWFAYDLEGNQIWIIGVGELVGNQLVIDDAVITSGGRFGLTQPQEAVTRSVWGRMVFTFIDCRRALFEYQGPPEFGSGTQDLMRLSGVDGRECDSRRDFRLGFTPFPPDLPDTNIQALLGTYDRIREHGDIIAHHFDDGIPWPEAAAGGSVSSYHPNMQADWNFRREMTPAGHQVYVAITPISISRDALAPYRGANPDTPRSDLGPPWDAIAFDDPLVKQAFLQHAIHVVEYFRPDYLAIGIEVNLLMHLAPDQWPAWLELHAATYQALKQRYPSLPVFVTATAGELLPGLTAADPAGQQQVLARVLPLTDLLGISFYPFLTALGTDPLPDDLFLQIDELTDKPIVIAETGFSAEVQQLDFDIGGSPVSLNLDGSLEKQRAYFERLMDAADRHQFRFVINFVPADYDALCDEIQCSDFSRIWRDTGLWDGQGNPRPALELWDAGLARPPRH